VARFLERTSAVPGATNIDYLLPFNRASDALFLRLGDGSFYILDAISLYRDFFGFTQGLLGNADKGGAQKYYNRRGVVVPLNVAGTLSTLFGEVNVHENLYYPLSEDRGEWGEADILIRYGRVVLLCEVKGHEFNPSISDPVGPGRMDRDFGTVRKGYRQCERTRRYISGGAPAEFFDRSHQKRLLVIDEPIDEFLFLVVTANSFGCLAGNCSDLLQVEEGILPVVMSEFELATFLAHVESPETLVEYLRQRVALHGFLKTSDKLEVAGVFVTQGSLSELIEMSKSADILQLAPDTSFVFNGQNWSRTPEIRKALNARHLTSTVFTAEDLGFIKED